MTLSNLIRKGGLAKVATATPATLATQEAMNAGTVAEVATVAVASPPASTMTAEEEAAIRAWLAHIEETDPDIIAEVLDRCRADPDAREYFSRRAGEVRIPSALDDDRRCCNQCMNLTERGLCLAAWRGEIVASRNYRPVRDRSRRCKGFKPGPEDADQRTGCERWPGLTMKED